MVVIDMMMGIIGIGICYYLALAYIGVSKSLRETWLPILLFTILAVFSKVFLHIPAFYHTCLLVFLCAIFLYFFSKVHLVESLVGSLLSFITETLASLLFALPMIQKLGVEISFNPNMDDLNWILVNLAEFIIPFVVLIILKLKKISIMRFTT